MKTDKKKTIIGALESCDTSRSSREEKKPYQNRSEESVKVCEQWLLQEKSFSLIPFAHK